jgi:hypothetical protein
MYPRNRGATTTKQQTQRYRQIVDHFEQVARATVGLTEVLRRRIFGAV